MQPVPPYLQAIKPANGVYCLTTPQPGFEEAYLQARQHEGWLSTDETVAQLPNVPAQHPHYAAWQMRRHSSKLFCQYLQQIPSPINVLEVGCGNGWFSHAMHLAQPNNSISGLDINLHELQQAARAFNQQGLHWVYADLFTAPLPQNYFHLVVLNASVQYFPSLQVLLNKLMELIVAKGEIHIMDSPFYLEHEVEAARARTTDYYTGHQQPRMAQYYHHHTIGQLAAYKPVTMYRPGALNRLLKYAGVYRSPFSWYKIEKGSSV